MLVLVDQKETVSVTLALRLIPFSELHQERARQLALASLSQ
jgi:hypothetical protein